MEVRALAALVAVADHGTFSAAAAALHTVQSNVSTHVRRLERELGVELIDRAAGRLTAAGEVVVERARRVQAELDALTADVAFLYDEVRGSVRLGVISTTARWLVPLLVDELDVRHPGVSLVIVDASTTSLAPQVTAGQLDLAILNLPVRDADLAVESLFEEELLVVVPETHRLAVASQSSSPTSWASRSSCLHPAPRSAPSSTPRPPPPGSRSNRAEIDGVRLISSLARAGRGIAILPVTATLHYDGLARVHLRGLPKRAVGLAWRRRTTLSAPARAVADLLREIVAQSSGANSSTTASAKVTTARKKTAPPKP